MNAKHDQINLPVEFTNKIKISDILILEDLQRLQDLFADANGVASIITHPDGTPITKPSNFTHLCKNIIRETEIGCANCFKSDAAIGRNNPSGPIVQQCLSGGLWDAGASITIGGKHIANWLIGQVRNEKIDEHKILLYADAIGADRGEFLLALNEVPIVPFEKFEKIAKMLFAYANQLSEKAYSNLQLRNEISKREKATALLQKSKATYQAILKASPDDITISNLEGQIILGSNASYKMFGVDKSFIAKDHHISDFIHPEDKELLAKNIALMHEGIFNHAHYRGLRNNGELFDIEVNGEFIRDVNGTPTQMIFIVRDITQRILAEEKLRESEEKHRVLFMESPDAYLIVRNGIITDCNRALEKMLLGDRSKIIGLSPSDLSPKYQPNGKASTTMSQAMINIAIQKGSHSFEWVHKRLDQKEFFVEASLATITLEKKPALFATLRDITERKKQEIALAESERSKSVLLSNLPGMAYRRKNDKNWVMQFVSDQCYALTGYHKESLIENKTISFKELILPSYHKYLENAWHKAITSHRNVCVEYEIKTATNETKWVWEQGLPIYRKDGEIEALEGFIIDITERKLLEVKLKENEAQYRNLADSGVALIWKSGVDKMCNYFNKPWLKFRGRIQEQEFGNGWMEGIHPDDLSHFITTYFDAFDQKEVFSMEYRLKCITGEYRWIIGTGTPNYDYQKQFIGYIGQCFDITERKFFENELSQKNKELFKVNAEKDKFFSIIAHDLRSPFTSFLGLTQILSDEASTLSQEEIVSFAESMKSSATGLYNLLENLLEWARMNQGLIRFHPTLLNLKTLIQKGIQPLMEHAKNKQITIQINPINITFLADEYMLFSVIRNLVSNALKYTPEGGRITISAIRKSEEVEIQVADNGIGMSENILENLFRIDEQTNRKGTNGEPSSGLGLILCKEFVERHLGKIHVESKQDKGTTFYVSIRSIY